MEEHQRYYRKKCNLSRKLNEAQFALNWQIEENSVAAEYAAERSVRLGRSKPMNALLRRTCKELQFNAETLWKDLYSDRFEPILSDKEVMEETGWDPEDCEEDEFPRAPIQVCAGTFYSVGPNRWVFVYDEEWLR